MGSEKGQLAMNETFYLIAGVVICLIVVIFVISILGGGKGWLDWACEEWPWICGESSTVDERLSAKTSTNALACAINYIANGEMGSECEIKEFSATVAKPSGVSDGYPPDLPGGLSFTGSIGAQYHDFITGMATTSGLQTNIVCGSGFKVKDERTVNCENCYKTCSESGGQKRECRCVEGGVWYDPIQKYQCQWIEDDPGQTKPTCFVTGFHLPQKIAKSVEFIPGLGDPNFLLYYQSFPQGEDAAWSGASVWMESSRTAIFAASCFLGAIRIVKGKGLGSELTGVAESAMASRMLKLWRWLSTKVLKKEAAGEFTEEIGIRFIKAQYKATVTGSGKAAFISRLRSIFPEMMETGQLGKIAFESFDTLVKSGAYTGTAAVMGLTLSEYVDRRIATEFGKFYPVEGKLLLQEPVVPTPIFEDEVFSEMPGASTLDEFESGKPIMDIGRPIVLDKESISKGIAPFYLASPCHADLKISMGDVACSSYTYNDDTESVFCDSPENPSFIKELLKIDGVGRRCGVVDDKLLEDIMGEENEEIVKDIKGVVIEPIASRGEKLLRMETGDFSINDPVTGYTFEFEYNESWSIVCCQIGNDKLLWYESSTCTTGGGSVVDDIECIKEENDLQLGYPLRIKSINDSSTGAPVKGITLNEIGEWPCVLRDPVLEENMKGEKFDEEVIEDIGFNMGSHSSEMFGVGRYVSCELNSSYWSGTTTKEEKMREKYPHRKDSPMSGIGGHNKGHTYTSIYFMAEVDDDSDLEGMRGIGVAFKRYPLFFVDGRYVEKPNDSPFTSTYSFMDTGNSKGLNNPDRVVDSVSLQTGMMSTSEDYWVHTTLRFMDSNSDGTFDSLEQTNCKVEAVKIAADKSQYSEEEGYEYNFCYRDRTFWGYAATVGMFISDIALQKLLAGVSGGASYLAGVVVDCGFIFLSMEKGHTEWPGEQ